MARKVDLVPDPEHPGIYCSTCERTVQVVVVVDDLGHPVYRCIRCETKRQRAKKNA